MDKIYLKPFGFPEETKQQLRLMVAERFGKVFLLSTTAEDAKASLSNNFSKLHLLWIDGEQTRERMKIWYLVKKYPEIPFVLCSVDAHNAYLAWQAGAFYFLKTPFNENELLRLVHKLKANRENDGPKFRFNYKNGYTLVYAEDVCFCKSDGNYTEIFLKDNKKIVVTRKLKELEEAFSICSFLPRVGKGLIVNINRISSVHNQLVKFDGMSVPVRFSDTYLRRMKASMLWYL